MAELKLLTVSELTAFIKQTLESMVGRVRVEGEISGLTLHGSGHAYFSLKDEKAVLKCVMFRYEQARLGFQLKNGLKVEATGEISVYAPSGQYQLVVKNILEAGIGELYRRFEALKKKLEAEGLFKSEHKKPIPSLPLRIGVITSPTGAAIRDIINILTRRFSHLHILIYPAAVQGKEAPPQIARAIRRMNDLDMSDVLIVGRGGGSIEDLWAFNEEAVARAIYESRIPIISAVGHETDFTIADFVADLRASTPSAAAELVTENHQRRLEMISDISDSLARCMARFIEVRRLKIEQLLESRFLHSPVELLRQYQQRLDYAVERLAQQLKNLLEQAKYQMRLWQGRLNALNPEGVLSRGYSIVVLKKPGEIIREALQAQPNDSLEIRLHKGYLEAQVINVKDEDSPQIISP